jgi:hypothetical protein
VMIKILLQEPHHILDVHGALNLVKLMLQRLILRTLLEGHNFGSIIHSAHHIHRQEFSGRSRPILVGLNEKEFLGGPGFLLVVDPRLHFLHSLLLSFRRAFHLGFYLVVDRVPIVSLIFFIKAKSSKLIGWVGKKLLHFPFVREELLVHLNYRGHTRDNKTPLVINLLLKTCIFNLVNLHFILFYDLIQELHFFDLFRSGFDHFLLLIIRVLLFILLALLALLFLLLRFLLTPLLLNLRKFVFFLLNFDLLFFFLLVGVVIYEASKHRFLLLFRLIEHLGGVDDLLILLLFRLLLLLLQFGYLF